MTKIRRVLENNFENYLHNRSGWTYINFETVFINLIPYESLTTRAFFLTPNARKGLVNIQNKGSRCFMYCHAALIGYFSPSKKHQYRSSKFTEYLKQLNCKGITFPITIEPIAKVEKQKQSIYKCVCNIR